MSAVVQIPLCRRDGSVRAVAVVDAIDEARVTLRGPWSVAAGYAWSRPDYLHRFIMGCTPGDGREVDHIDGDPLNCRRSNLRATAHAENQQNRHGAWGSSSHRGVSWHRKAGKWQANVTLAGRQHYLGLFEREEDAASAAAAFRAEHMPFSADAAREARLRAEAAGDPDREAAA